MTKSDRLSSFPVNNPLYPWKTKMIGKKWLGSLSLLLILPLITGKVILPQTANAQTTSKQQFSAEANILYVDSKQGRDRQGDGTKESPLKTITEALKLAKSDTIIHLNPGTYNEQTGETFPLVISKRVTIQGSPSSKGHNVVINGSGDFISPTGAGQQVTIAAIKEAQGLTGVTVMNPHSRGHGLWIESSSPTVTNNSFIRNGNTGLSVNGRSDPNISDNYFSRNGGNGLLIYGTSKPQVENNEFENTGFGVSIVQNSAPTLLGNTFSRNRIGVILEGNSQAVLRNNEITNSAESGLVAIAQSRVDLGTTTQPGENIFRGNKNLDIQNGTPNSITAAGTEISGKTEGSIDFMGTAIAPRTTETTELRPLKLLSPLSPNQTPISREASQPLPVAETANSNSNTLPQPKAITYPASPPVLREASQPLPVAETANSSSNTLPQPKAITYPASSPVSREASETKATNELVFTVPPDPSTLSNSTVEEQVDSSSSKTDIDRPAKLPVPAVPQSSALSPQIKPSTLTSSPQNTQISSLSDVLGGNSIASTSTSTTKYKVIAEATSDSQKAQVRSMYPDAFNTTYQGKSMLQVGVFGNQNTAENVLQSLEKIGIQGIILN
ncbi:MAG: DUF1565 domain-containing protein [Xenococcaceae cyanobacterium]